MAQQHLSHDRSTTKKPKLVWILIGSIGGAIILLIAGIILYVSVGRPALSPKQAVTFEPDRSILGTLTISDETLQETAKLLSQRWGFLGYSSPWASFQVNADGKISGRVPATVSQDFIDEAKVTGVLEFVDFGQMSVAPGSVVNTDYSYGYETAEGTKWHTIMTGGLIHTVSAYQSPTGAYEVLFSLTDKGKQILADFTTAHAGSFLGIVMDKTVISCPRIAGPITSGSGVINANFTQQQAQIFAAIIRSGPLPIPLK